MLGSRRAACRWRCYGPQQVASPRDVGCLAIFARFLLLSDACAVLCCTQRPPGIYKDQYITDLFK
jgi:hypothetical protein